MPVPSTFNDIDTNPNNNSPQGSEAVGPYANQYLQTAFAFIKQLAIGSGLVPTSALNMNGQKITNLAAGSTSSTSTDAITGAQARALAYKVGEQRMWHGAIANIATVWGPGWQLADGTNGTADCRARFIVGADGSTYSPGATGGNASNTLTVAQLPSHGHSITDNGHTHPVGDGGHTHTDAGHAHTQHGSTLYFGGGGTVSTSGATTFPANTFTLATATATANIQSSTTGVSVQSHTTGIAVNNTGSGGSIENRPPYYASCIIEYTGIGA